MSDVSVTEGVGGSIALLFGVILAGSAGIGGGGLNVPILKVFFGFDFTKAAVLSLCCVLGNLISQLILNRNSPHPNMQTRALAYWDLVLCFLPGQLCGAAIGILFRDMIPSTVLECVAMVVLTFASTKTYLKGVIAREKEKLPVQQVSEADLQNALLDPSSRKSSFNVESQLSQRINNLSISSVKEIEHPWRTIGIITMFWAIYVSILVSIKFVEKCSAPYLVLILVVYLPLLIQLLWGVNYVQRKQIDFPNDILEGDINWKHNPYLGPCCAVVVGLASSLLGIGGGELSGPLLLSFKVLPQVTAGTTSILSGYTTLSNVVQYAVRGEIPLVYGSWVFSIGLVGGFIGRKAAMFISTSYGRPSVTIFALSAVLCVGCVLLLYTVIEEGADLESLSFCEED